VTAQFRYNVHAGVVAVSVGLVVLVVYFVWLFFHRPLSKVMLVVLPFENLSGDQHQEYFCIEFAVAEGKRAAYGHGLRRFGGLPCTLRASRL
jgi:hypothetical protein